jgi:hypothetical protein
MKSKPGSTLMKPHRDAAALAASLTVAANTPLPLPQTALAAAASTASPKDTEAESNDPPKKSRKVKVVAETVGITLRPDRELLNRYTMAAAERTKKEGKVISAQQIMLEVLERGMRAGS